MEYKIKYIDGGVGGVIECVGGWIDRWMDDR